MSHEPAKTSAPVRHRLLAQGQVQGVGFRPFVFRLACELELTGSVGNTSEGVCIEIQGTEEHVRRFPLLLREQLPPLAMLTALSDREIPPSRNETEFSIVLSHGHHGHNVLISPDVGLCPDCAADMRDRDNARYRYAFTNCTNCGPRYTITRSIPYDRAVTSMACFPMCPDCAKEYTDPRNRRFHAQPIACPVCGPRLWFVTHEDALAERTAPCAEHMDKAIERACSALCSGRIVALRGLGGFQLACDARDKTVVHRLRQRKHRPHKAFALMVRDAETARSLCQLSTDEEALLASPARPAVILQRHAGVLPEEIAPDTETLAVMLPTTPLHVVILETLASMCLALGRQEPVLIMTSGNDSGDPICLGNREALGRLGGIADDFLLHDRDILCRVDDSVVTCLAADQMLPFRRARGYVPAPIPLQRSAPVCVFGAGADLKAACCVTRDQDAFVGQHIGDLEHVSTLTFYDEVVAHLLGLLEVPPGLVVADCHPDFHSTRAAAELAARHHVPLVTLQHHAAHAASVLAEYHVEEPSLVLVLDGYGYGLDGTAWGGELIRMDLGRAQWSRQGHLRPFPLPGGDAAARSPWRLAVSLAESLTDRELAQRILGQWDAHKGREASLVRQMLERRINTPLCSSCGRLFDAVSAQLGLCGTITYEGQAAIRLERQALGAERAGAISSAATFAACLPDEGNVLDASALFARVCRLQEEGVPTAQIALDFHTQLAHGLVQLVLRTRRDTDAKQVGLCGGVLNNSLMRRLLGQMLRQQGLTPLLPSRVPAGDGGISLGQAAWGAALLNNKALVCEPALRESATWQRPR